MIIFELTLMNCFQSLFKNRLVFRLLKSPPHLCRLRDNLETIYTKADWHCKVYVE